MPLFSQLKKKDPRLRLLTLTVAVGMIVLLVGLWWVQIVSARDYQQRLVTQSFRTVRIPAVRGKILDRNGIALADNRPRYDVVLYLEELSDRFRREYARLRPTRTVTNVVPFWKRWLGVSSVRKKRVRLNQAKTDALEWKARFVVVSNVVRKVSEGLQIPIPLDFARFRNHYTKQRALPFTVLENLSPVQVARFEEQCARLPSVDLQVEPMRYYPYQTTAAHVLGYLLRDDRSIEGEDAYFSYRLPDYRGVVGIEGGYDKVLHGHAGVKSVLVNNLGYRQSANVWTPAVPGRNIVLTIDLHIQQAAEAALHDGPSGADTCGAAIVMNVHSGNILAMASSPTYNPNWFIPHLSVAHSQILNNKKLRPEINRATQGIAAPGSTFKPVVGLACLETGMNPQATIYNPGYIYVGRRRFGDLAPPGEYDFRKAIADSCNTYFITNGMKAGIKAIVKMGERFCFGKSTGLHTRQESTGYFPSLKRVESDWYKGDTANFCIGQGYLAVTPLQMTVMTAALANGGKVLWPRLVARIESQDPSSDQPPTVFPKGRVRDELGVSQHNLQLLKNAMRAEVLVGTGRKANVPGMDPCGKTGTAQVTNGHDRQIGKTTWFISFGPYEDPKYAVVVMVEHGMFGGTTCAPMAAKIYRALLKWEGGQGSQHHTVASN